MTKDNITKLQAIPKGTPAAITEEAFIEHLSAHIRDNDILDDWDESDVELDQPSSDEKKLGELNQLERRCFVIGRLMRQILSEEIIDIHAANTDTMASIMRERRVSIEVAAQIVMSDSDKYLDPDTSATLVQIATTATVANSMFDWLVRSRFGVWPTHVIVRSGFIAYSYDG